MQRDLVLRAQTGDHDAFASLATQAFDRLHRSARLILRDTDAASDAVQDALMAAWRDIRALRDPDRFDAWLYRLLINGCYRAASRDRRRRVMEVHVMPVDIATPRLEPDDVVLRDELSRAFRRLTTEQRAVIVLHHFLGLKDQEAGDVLGIPMGTYKSRLNRATAAMRASLEADAREPMVPKESMA